MSVKRELTLQSTPSKEDNFGSGTVCPSYKESTKRSKERQGPTLAVRFTEVFVKRESTVVAILKLSITVDQIQKSCRKSLTYMYLIL